RREDRGRLGRAAAIGAVVSAVNPPRLVSVKLTPVGRPHSVVSVERAGDRQPRTGDQVVVQDESGTAVGTVVRSIPALAERRLPAGDPPPGIVRVATREDIITRLKQEQREKEAYRIASLKIRERGLGMKLARVEMQFDGSRLIFYFTAEGRVDFRELVRELAGEFRMRIEMR